MQTVIDIIGNTPQVLLANVSKRLSANIFGKLEYLNPFGSIKDRVAKRMLQDLEENHGITSGTHIIEATNGNTGIALAALCRIKGYQLHVVMAGKTSVERRMLLTSYGVKQWITPRELGIKGALAKVHELKQENPLLIDINQGVNPHNPEAHYDTAHEIISDCNTVDAIVVGVGTGGTYRGLYDYCKHHAPHVRVIAVEPEEASVLSGSKSGIHSILGIGAGLIPPHLNERLPSKENIISVSSELAISSAQACMREEGLPIGISSGATLAAAEILKRKNPELTNIVCIFASQAERYYSTELFTQARQDTEAQHITSVTKESLHHIDHIMTQGKHYETPT